MLTDVFAFEHSTSNSAAVTVFESVVAGVAAHKPVKERLQDTLALAPGLPAALALQGMAAVIMGVEPSLAVARSLVPAVDKALAAVDGGTDCERALATAQALAAEGKLQAAATTLEQRAAVAPREFLIVKLAHALRFMSGQPQAMLATIENVLPAWNATDPGYGYLLGCRAFALEETGDRDLAEVVGRHALDYSDDDVWALHAVAHVMEMTARTHDGIAWLSPTRELWKGCGNFGGHLAWHLALFHLALDDRGAALALFDDYLPASPSCDFRDVANATSMLWRLEQIGLDVGDRWSNVGEIASSRRRDTAYAFGSLHNLLGLIGARRISEAHELVEAMRAAAVRAITDQDQVFGRVGVELAELLLGLAEKSKLAASLASVAGNLECLGGSIAQRDVFLRTLILLAADQRDELSVARLKGIRARQRRSDSFLRLVERRFAEHRSGGSLAATA